MKSTLQTLLRRLLPIAALLLVPVQAFAWWNDQWAFRKPITITLPPGTPAAATGEVPVLIRLHEGVLRFGDASPDGSDLRFVAGDDQTALPYHIEKYDEVFNLAFVWVRLPAAKAGEPQQLWMYYGNPKASSESDSKALYGFDQSLVWHFSERGTPAQDASAAGHHGTAAFASSDSGLIGGSARFDGQSAIVLPASPALQLQPNRAGTWSLWAKPAAPVGDAVLYAQTENGAGLTIGIKDGLAYASVIDASGAEARAVASQALTAESWQHLAVAVDANLTLYVNGELQSQTPVTVPAVAAAGVLGAANADVPPAHGFTGEIDELQIAKTVRPAATIRLAALNQGTADPVVQFGLDEQQSSWDTGYAGILLGAVTLDGWIVIVVLMVMMVISWGVMASKGGQIGRIGKANDAFLNLFRSTGGDFAALHHLLHGTAAVAGVDLPESRRKLVLQSPLAHMFQVGVEELHQRLKGDSRAGLPSGILSAQSIEAIRATINSSLVREQQQLNRRMVLLTIAIAGGPFIGLLGTVVGVMITFAAVAAAGDVNINAIAPGIAAALVATVAGLFVAIPALFGYNYLITRIKEVVAEMQVFIDAFITRMAENYNAPGELQAMAD